MAKSLLRKLKKPIIYCTSHYQKLKFLKIDVSASLFWVDPEEWPVFETFPGINKTEIEPENSLLDS